MYSEFYLKNLDNYSFTPTTPQLISTRGISILSRTKYSFRVISNQKYAESVTYNIEFDESFKLRSISPSANNLTTINLLFYLSNYYMNILFQNLYSQDFEGADDEYLRNFIREFISCNLSFEKLDSYFDLISSETNKPKLDLLKIYIENLKRYYFFDNLLNLFDEIINNSKDQQLREFIIQQIVSLIEMGMNTFTSLQVNKIAALLEKISDEEFLTILKNQEYQPVLLNSGFNIDTKLQKLIDNEELISNEELIQLLPADFLEKYLNNHVYNYFTLLFYFNKKSKAETENILNRYISSSKESSLKLFYDERSINLLCNNKMYKPILNFCSMFLSNKLYPINSTYYIIQDILKKACDHDNEFTKIACDYLNKEFPDSFTSIFKCIIDKDSQDERSYIYEYLGSDVLIYCNQQYLPKLLIKMMNFYPDYLIKLYDSCKSSSDKTNIFLKVLLSDEIPTDEISKSFTKITPDTLTKTPLVILLDKKGKLEEAKIKKVDL